MLLVFSIVPAYAETIPEETTVASVIEASQLAAERAGIDTGLDVALVAEDNTFVTREEDREVRVSSNGDTPVTIASTDTNTSDEYAMTLPESSSSKIRASESGEIVVLPSSEEPDVSYTVSPTEDGNVRVESVIASIDAPEKYAYTFPGIDRIQVDDNQEVVWLFTSDDQGNEQLEGIVEAAWAKDANGEAVPTYFKADGNVLTQVVQHRSGEFAYPIVADPNWWDKAVAWAKKASTTAAEWLKKNKTWLARSGKAIVKKIAPGAVVLCAIGAGWAWYRSDAKGWVRVGDAVAGCIV